MKKLISVVVCLFVFSTQTYAESEETNIEKFMNQNSKVIFTRIKPIDQINDIENKPLIIDGIIVTEIVSGIQKKGIEISYSKSPYDDYYVFSTYIDSDEVNLLIISLNTIWNFLTNLQKDEIGIISTTTRSGLSVATLEISAEQGEDIKRKYNSLRLAFLITPEAKEKLERLNDYSKINDIDQLVIFPLEGIKNLIISLEKAKTILNISN